MAVKALRTLKLPGIDTTYSLLTVDDIYPVGSVYMSFDSTSPASRFGGTWEQIKDVFLLAAGSTYKAGATGGEAAHTLTKDELPHFKADVYITVGGVNYQVMYVNAASRADGQSPYFVVNSGSTKVWADIDGGGQAHNNMPPYLTVYMWRRTA